MNTSVLHEDNLSNLSSNNPIFSYFSGINKHALNYKRAKLEQNCEILRVLGWDVLARDRVRNLS
jgi:hypothetical protein